MAVRMLFLVCALLTSVLSYAQQTQSSGKLIYLELSELSVETYDDFYAAIKASSNFESVETCIPAKIAVIRVKTPSNAGVSKDFEQVTAVIRGASFTSIKMLESCNDDRFMEKCKEARYVRQ